MPAKVCRQLNEGKAKERMSKFETVKHYVNAKLSEKEKEKDSRKRGTKTALMVHISKKACARGRNGDVS